MSIATGRDPEASRLLSDLSKKAKLAIPQVCFLEAFVVLQEESRQRRSFKSLLDQQIIQLSRDVTSTHAAALRTSLDSARIENKSVLEEIQERLFNAISSIGSRADLIGLNAQVLEANRNHPLIADLTDNLILHCILEHARHDSTDTKVLLSGNRKDFGTKSVQAALQTVGISKYVVDARQFLGWLRPEPPT